MIPTRVGQRVLGGYFAGMNRIENHCYAINASSKTTETNLPVKCIESRTPNTHSVSDGFSNTLAMNNFEHPAAQYCLNLDLDACNDFYLPSRDELELCYRNLKPVNYRNAVYSTNLEYLGKVNGTNCNSIPVSVAYTETTPAQTLVVSFKTGSSESFSSTSYVSSTEYSLFSLTIKAIGSRDFVNGRQSMYKNTDNYCIVRAVGRIQIV